MKKLAANNKQPNIAAKIMAAVSMVFSQALIYASFLKNASLFQPVNQGSKNKRSFTSLKRYFHLDGKELELTLQLGLKP